MLRIDLLPVLRTQLFERDGGMSQIPEVGALRVERHAPLEREGVVIGIQLLPEISGSQLDDRADRIRILPHLHGGRWFNNGAAAGAGPEAARSVRGCGT